MRLLRLNARSYVAALSWAVLACVCAPAGAQDDLAPEQRRAYNQGLEDTRKLVGSKQWAAAAQRLEKLLAQRPREAQARFLNGVVQTEQGQRDQAVETFEALIADYPELPEPYNNLAVIYAQKGELENARATLELAVRTAPDWAIARENLGDVYARIAVEHYSRAVALDRTSRSAAAKLQLARQLALASGAAPAASGAAAAASAAR